jgi:hypothetical protein
MLFLHTPLLRGNGYIHLFFKPQRHHTLCFSFSKEVAEGVRQGRRRAWSWRRRRRRKEKGRRERAKVTVGWQLCWRRGVRG